MQTLSYVEAILGGPVLNNLILLGEDEADAVLLLREAFQDAKVICPVVDLPNGRAIMDYLSGARPFNDRWVFPLPGLVLLDLHMPIADGFEVLAWRQKRPELMTLPIVVLTSSDFEDDKEKAKVLGADDYLMKPTRYKDFVVMASDLNKRWLSRPVPGTKMEKSDAGKGTQRPHR